MENQAPEWRVDGHTFTALRKSITQFHAVLAWLLHPPRSEDRVETFVRLLPIVTNLETLLVAIVRENIAYGRPGASPEAVASYSSRSSDS